MKPSLAILPTLALAAALAQPAQAGTFTLDVAADGRTVTLSADQASSNEIIAQMAQKLGIATRLSRDTDRSVTLDLRDVPPEEVVHQLSDSYAMAFTVDPDTNRIRIVSIFTGGMPPPTQQRALTTPELIKLIEDKAKSIKRYKARMVMTMSMLGSDMTMEGDMVVCGDNQMRMEMTLPGMIGKQTTAVDGDTTYVYSEMMPMVQKIDAAKLREALGMDAPPQGFGNQQFQVSNPFGSYNRNNIEFAGTREEGGRTYHTFNVGLPKEMETMKAANPILGGLDRSEVWFDAETGVPARNVMLGKDGKSLMDIKMQDTVINPPAEELDCSFQLPENAPVVDMTDSIVKMMQALKQPAPAPDAE